MKLQDLAAPQKIKQVAKVMENYFGKSVAFDQLTPKQAQTMLTRVRGLIAEQRRQPSFHQSEQNPAYLKLLMMEQGLAPVAAGQTSAQSAAQQSAMIAQRKKDNQEKIKTNNETIKMLQQQNQQLQQAMNSPVGEGKTRRLREASEVQQAQVVLASKDMVDQVQKMIEQTTSIQFKDLPALVDQIRNEVGYDVATQFNTDATAALSGLVQNLQASKGQLEQALGVVTGQAPTVPGTEAVSAELPAVEPEQDLDIDAEIDVEEPADDLETSLGRAKR